MKQVVVVAPHFPPSNLAAVHRSRYFAMHLPKFGWNARVLSVDPHFYEERLDPEIEELVPGHVEVIRTKALSTRPIRFVGDIGIRAFWWHYRALCSLIKRERVDLLYIPIPPNYSALLGPLIHRRFGIPYAIDYIDPWVNTWPGCEVPLSKAWFSYRLGKWLEPVSLRGVSLITAVAPGYYQGCLDRYNWIDESLCVAMPYGAEVADFAYLDENPRATYLFDPADGNVHIVYAGAMLPKAYPTLDALCRALLRLREEEATLAAQLRFHFIGTGSNPTDPSSFMVKPWTERYELGEMIHESPARIPFLDVLNHLKSAHGVIVLGSPEAHYTPSKIFQAVLARRPVLALLHAQSTAGDILRRSRAGRVVTFDEQHPVGDCVEEICSEVQRLATTEHNSDEVDWTVFDAYSAEAMTRRLAAAFDSVA